MEKMAINYKNVEYLKKFLTDRGKIISRQKSGLTANEQRQLTRAVKQARYMALISPVIQVVR